MAKVLKRLFKKVKRICMVHMHACHNIATGILSSTCVELLVFEYVNTHV